MFHRTRWACRWRFISSLTHWSFGDDLLPSREASPRTALNIEKPRMDAGHSRHTEGALAPTLTQTDHADMEKTLTVQLLAVWRNDVWQVPRGIRISMRFWRKVDAPRFEFCAPPCKAPRRLLLLGLHFSTKHTHYFIIIIIFRLIPLHSTLSFQF